MNRPNRSRAGAAIAALALILAACGSDSGDDSATDTTVAGGATTSAAAETTAAETTAPQESTAEETTAESTPEETTAESTTETTEAPVASGDTDDLVLWVYDDGRIEILKELGEEFKEEYGVGVTVEAVDLGDLRNAMELGIEGTGPDLAIIPHDNLGGLVENGAVAPVDLGDRTAEYLPATIDAMTYGGELVGVPLAIENIGFFYNTDLVDTPPATWDEVKTIGAALVESGDADAAVGLPDLTYNSYPIYTSFGGYIFGRDADGSFTADDIGMADAGMVKGLEYITSLVDEGIVSENIDWEATHVLFETGRLPFILTGPWALNRFNDAGVKYAIAPFPAAEAGGEAGYPFLGVQGLIVSANSPKQLLAQTFATEKIATEDSMKRIFEAEPRPSAWASVFALADDEDTKGFNAAGAKAQPMPSLPAMGFVWDAWVKAGTLSITDEVEPKDALAQAVEQIQAQIDAG